MKKYMGELYVFVGIYTLLCFMTLDEIVGVRGVDIVLDPMVYSSNSGHNAACNS